MMMLHHLVSVAHPVMRERLLMMQAMLKRSGLPESYAIQALPWIPAQPLDEEAMGPLLATVVAALKN